jgi:hypothetical protein
MIETLRLRRRRFENSAATALIDANMPPMPRPVNTRHVDSSTMVEDCVAMTNPRTMSPRQPSSSRRRPSRSASPPSTMEPTPMPINSIDSTIPNAARSRPHCRTS